jgi:hypothetical protein
MANSDNLIHFLSSTGQLCERHDMETWSIIILKDVPTVRKYFSDYWPYIITKSL